MDWKEVRLGDVCDVITKGTTPSNIGASFTEYGVKYIRSEMLGASKYISNCGFLYISEDTHNRLKRSQLKENDILFSMAGAYLGKTALLRKQDVPSNTNQAVALIRTNPNLCDVNFVYYSLNLPSTVSFINTSCAQSAQPNINLRQIGDLIISLPSIEIQSRIATILSSLDSKIETNNKFNAKLEEMAQTLFKSWFVDFEPFKDKGMVESELGMIPEGWRVGKLADITTQQTTKVKDREDVKVLSPVTTGELLLSEEYFSKQVYSTNIAKYKVVKVGHFAYNPARVNIGSLGMNEFDFDGCVSPVYIVFSTNEGYEFYFDLFRKRESFKKSVESLAIGGVRQSLNYDDFAGIECIIPSKESIEEFNKIYIEMRKQVQINKTESSRLSQLRDTLLPKLMSGEIEI